MSKTEVQVLIFKHQINFKLINDNKLKTQSSMIRTSMIELRFEI